MAVVIYTKPGCPYCQQARDYYNSQGIPFKDYDAQNDRKRRKEMLEFSDGDPTVPCIVENGEYVGSGWGSLHAVERCMTKERPCASVANKSPNSCVYQFPEGTRTPGLSFTRRPAWSLTPDTS